jgi:hypothetical protein
MIVLRHPDRAVTGALTARGAAGHRLDMAQYAAVFGIAFGVAALFLTIAWRRGMPDVPALLRTSAKHRRPVSACASTSPFSRRWRRAS